LRTSFPSHASSKRHAIDPSKKLPRQLEHENSEKAWADNRECGTYDPAMNPSFALLP